MGKFTGRSSSAEFIGRLLGIDPDRLLDRVDAERERERFDHDQLLDSVRAKASMVKRAKILCEIEEWAWRQNPSSGNLRAAMAAQASRNEAEKVLLEVCANDRSLMSAVLRQG